MAGWEPMSINPPKSDRPAPKESFWVTAPRENFTARCWSEEPRMRPRSYSVIPYFSEQLERFGTRRKTKPAYHEENVA